LKALRSAAQEENELTSKSVEIALIGPSEPFRILSLAEVDAYFKELESFKPEDEMEVV